MRSWLDPSRDATDIIEAEREVMEQSGEKSGMFSKENETGERSNNHAIRQNENSLSIYLSHSLGKNRALMFTFVFIISEALWLVCFAYGR
jgi:hypothetical protein